MAKRRARRPKGINHKKRRHTDRRDHASPPAIGTPGPPAPPAPSSSAVTSQPPTPPGSSSEHATQRELTFSNVFGTMFWVFAALSAVAGAVCYVVLGPAAFTDSLKSDVDLLLFLIPRFAAAMLIAAFVGVLLPRDRVARYVSDRAGLRALAIGTVAGALTPGGPMTSFPLVRALRDAGTGRSPLIAYITSWSTMGFQRIINWELPLLGPELTLMRLASSLPLPIIAGLIARWWPQARSSRKAGGDV